MFDTVRNIAISEHLESDLLNRMSKINSNTENNFFKENDEIQEKYLTYCNMRTVKNAECFTFRK